MTKASIKSYIAQLSATERTSFLLELNTIKDSSLGSNSHQLSRRQLLDDKQGACPHCGHGKYVRFGKDKGAQRYKCQRCKRNFTEYTGTWMARLHKKEKIADYLELMVAEKSLDKIKTELQINKKTAFDWRHKILSSLTPTEPGVFKGITESDETFFRFSPKGQRKKVDKTKKKGKPFSAKRKRGIGSDQVKVIVTQDRNKEMDLTMCGKRRLTKADISSAIGKRIHTSTILCSDSHMSYKGFGKDKNIEHHALRSDMQQHVKEKKIPYPARQFHA